MTFNFLTHSLSHFIEQCPS